MPEVYHQISCVPVLKLCHMVIMLCICIVSCSVSAWSFFWVAYTEYFGQVGWTSAWNLGGPEFKLQPKCGCADWSLCGFLQAVQENEVIVVQFGCDCFLLHPSQFVTYCIVWAIESILNNKPERNVLANCC